MQTSKPNNMINKNYVCSLLAGMVLCGAACSDEQGESFLRVNFIENYENKIFTVGEEIRLRVEVTTPTPNSLKKITVTTTAGEFTIDEFINPVQYLIDTLIRLNPVEFNQFISIRAEDNRGNANEMIEIHFF